MALVTSLVPSVGRKRRGKHNIVLQRRVRSCFVKLLLVVSIAFLVRCGGLCLVLFLCWQGPVTSDSWSPDTPGLSRVGLGSVELAATFLRSTATAFLAWISIGEEGADNVLHASEALKSHLLSAEFEGLQQDDIYVQKATKDIVNMCECLQSLLYPPGRQSSVDYVMTNRSTESDAALVGKAISQNKFWRSLHLSHCKNSLLMGTLGPELATATSEVATEASTKILEILVRVPVWRDALPRGLRVLLSF
eukprot:6465604-Amphidinium_carterae.3